MAQLIGDFDLSWMRDLQERAMPGTIVIQRRTFSRDAMGGMAETWAAVGTAVGRMYPQNTRAFNEPLAGERVTAEGRWFATFPEGTDVTAEDRLSYDNRTFEVIRVNNSQMWQTAVRAECYAHNEEQRL